MALTIFRHKYNDYDIVQVSSEFHSHKNLSSNLPTLIERLFSRHNHHHHHHHRGAHNLHRRFFE